MTAGFLYVLINPAMPGLAKVGKTTRSTSARQAELSSATGVPTPFILAFEQPVVNCHAAENWVHEELTRRGFRESSNREFFNAPLHEIVALVSVAHAIGAADSSHSNFVADEHNSAQVHALQLASLGDSYRDGSADMLRDSSKALACYEQAAALGDDYATNQAAQMLLQGSGGIKVDEARALGHLKKLAQKDKLVAGQVALLYSKLGQPQSAVPYWKVFVTGINERTFDLHVQPLWRYCFDLVNIGVERLSVEGLIGRFGPVLLDGVNNALYAEEIDDFGAEKTRAYIVECVGAAFE